MPSIISRVMTMLRIFFALVMMWAVAAQAAEPQVTGYQLEAKTNGNITLRLQINQMLDFKTFTLEKPDRVVVDIAGATWQVPPNPNPKSEEVGFVKKLRAGTFKPGTLRVVLDATQPVRVVDSFIHVPSQKKESHYLVMQMQPLAEATKQQPEPKKNFAKPQASALTETKAQNKEKQKSKVEQKPEPATTEKVAEAEETVPAKPEVVAPMPKNRPEHFTIVIDPGHGGVDPGAIGKTTKEKEVTLRYALHLQELLNASPRYTVVMTRADDTYVSLRGRVEISKEAQGDLFISLHADSHPEPTMQGLSVYTLSEKASDKEAEALADRENKKDIIIGVDLSEESQDVAEVLIDLAQRDTKNTSARFAELVVAELGTEAKLLKNSHRFAGFAVLKAVGIPSVLVELGYLSNPKEEAQLISKKYQDKLIRAIARAVDTYCDKYVLKAKMP